MKIKIEYDSFENMFEDAVRAGLIIDNNGKTLEPHNSFYSKSPQYHCYETIHSLAFKEWMKEVKGREYDNEEYKTFLTKENFKEYLSIQAAIKAEQKKRDNLDNAEDKKDIICRKCMSQEEVIKINTCEIAEYIVLNGMSDNEMICWIKHYCTGEHETSEIYDTVCFEIVHVESDVFPNKAYIDVLRRFRHLIEVRTPKPQKKSKTLKPNITENQIKRLSEAVKDIFEATQEQWQALFDATEIQLTKPIDAKTPSDIAILMYYLRTKELITTDNYPSIIEHTSAFTIKGVSVVTAKQISAVKENYNFPCIGKNYTKIEEAVTSL